MSKHYHVVAGLRGGYIPNTNDVYETKREALAGAKWHVDQYHESGEKVRGSAKAGFWAMREGSYGELYDYVEVNGPCFDDCESWND